MDCDDGNPCTKDSCAEGKCTYEPFGGVCSDNDACTIGDSCAAGKCVGIQLKCDDSNECTDNVCDSEKGCVFTPNELDCPDDDPCTVTEKCQNGGCVKGQKDCDDDNVCTLTYCDPQISNGCVTVNQPVLCDDGDACTEKDSCAAGKCIGVGKDCDDGNVCTDETCDKLKGCEYTDNTNPCNDNSACTVGDKCAGGNCVVSVVDCDDNDPCTADSCDVQKGCEYELSSPSCGTCQSFNSIQCNDSLNGAIPSGPGGSIPGYGCVPGKLHSFEAVYTYVAPYTGDTKVSVAGGSANLAVAVVEEVQSLCRSKNCIAGGTESATFTMVKGITYYIVVDALETSTQKSYTIDLKCL